MQIFDRHLALAVFGWVDVATSDVAGEIVGCTDPWTAVVLVHIRGREQHNERVQPQRLAVDDTWGGHQVDPMPCFCPHCSGGCIRARSVQHVVCTTVARYSR